eukprot:1448268-Lingulodinium_polyedra.AAC.1
MDAYRASNMGPPVGSRATMSADEAFNCQGGHKDHPPQTLAFKGEGHIIPGSVENVPHPNGPVVALVEEPEDHAQVDAALVVVETQHGPVLQGK